MCTPNGLERAEDVRRTCGGRAKDARETYTIDESDPLPARARSTWSTRPHHPDLPWDTRVETVSAMTCDAQDFITTDEVVCKDCDEVVFHQTREKRIPRTADWRGARG